MLQSILQQMFFAEDVGSNSPKDFVGAKVNMKITR